tara:strand:- start:6838 stop:8427 length:1590 start_codon:yes stop_codon:yes gene_type:complete
MKIIYSEKSFFIIFLFIYFLVGAFYSLNTGLSFDEWVEQRIWEYNVVLVKHILFEAELDPSFINYAPKYYGIGFQIISQPIQFILARIILEFQNIDSFGAHLLAKHFVVFISFFVSGIFIYLIISKIINNSFFCKTATFLYLLYPYLLGHGLFNPKDIPFLCFWIICTYISINIFSNLTKNGHLNYRDVVLISFLSAFLLSIRVAGVLIFIQYLFTLIIFLNSEKLKFGYFLKSNHKKILSFILLTMLFTYLFYPVFWRNPLLFFDAINTMSYHWNNVCTLTLGKCMFSKNLDPTYVPIWLSVKLPVVIIIGLILLPLTEKKIFITKTNNITFGTLLFSSLFIPILLILKKVHLYDELRQILFLIPLIFILGVVSLYVFSKKIFYFLTFITLIIFLIENIKIYPYQYVWFNTPSRILNLSKNFELDYWGLSGRDLAKNISKLNKQSLKKPCILVTPPWLVQPFLDSNSYSCFGLWQDIDSNFPRPFWAVQNVRNLKKGKSYKCDSIYESKFSFLFSNEDIITGRLIKCI